MKQAVAKATAALQRVDGSPPVIWGFQNSPRVLEAAVNSIEHFQQLVYQSIHNRTATSKPKRQIFKPEEIANIRAKPRRARHRILFVKGTTEIYEAYLKKMLQRLLGENHGPSQPLGAPNRAFLKPNSNISVRASSTPLHLSFYLQS